ncbi:MAG TPA: DUF3011 domain-containing protein [Gemmatimonadaceae bacterium]|nr:DUF3011 domain-containing protein [Gemmatimonadaceae bacterium]
MPSAITPNIALLLVVFLAAPAAAQDTPDDSSMSQNAPATQLNPVRMTCSSKVGETTHCAADTSKGVVLARSYGTASCLLGKTWGYDDQGVWVSDGCIADFLVAGTAAAAQAPATTKKAPRYVPNGGFLIVEDELGEVYVRLFSYARYLNQLGLDETYTDAFGKVHTVQRRQDAQLQKFFLPFSGWFLTPNFRYYLYVWSANTSQGDAAQVVGGGNISYVFNKYVTFGGGITSLPSVRSTEGQFPYWLGVDDRLIADEFFRGSYTSGFWLKGELATKFKYMAMIANNLSTLGVSAAQMDNTFDTQSYMLQWLPTTGEFGLWGTFGDFDYHEKLATRLAIHYTSSTEDKQSQPGTDGIENSQIRLTDGSQIFTPDLFGPGITVNRVKYRMSSVDGGLKYKGLSFEAEYYWRWLSDYEGSNVLGIPNINDHGYQVQASAMVVPKSLQGYFGNSGIYGKYGDPWEVRGGLNWYPVKQRGFRVNGEWIHVDHAPVGYTAYPMPVGAKGNVFHASLELNFWGISGGQGASYG